jgi:hypothetical protein
MNPGLHSLCFRGNARGSEGHTEHVNGVAWLTGRLQALQPSLPGTKFILHNVLWADELGLYNAYAKKVQPGTCGATHAVVGGLGPVARGRVLGGEEGTVAYAGTGAPHRPCARVHSCR